jgi:hypothetical protein
MFFITESSERYPVKFIQFPYKLQEILFKAL